MSEDKSTKHPEQRNLLDRSKPFSQVFGYDPNVKHKYSQNGKLFDKDGLEVKPSKAKQNRSHKKRKVKKVERVAPQKTKLLLIPDECESCKYVDKDVYECNYNSKAVPLVYSEKRVKGKKTYIVTRQTRCPKSREELIEEIERKRWAEYRNLGPGEGSSGDWTLCDIGPENAYINLTEKAVRKIDEDDLKGFWKEACSLLTDDGFDYVYRDKKAFIDFFVKGIWLKENHSGKIVDCHLKTINKDLKEKLRRMHKKENYRGSWFDESGYTAYISLIKTVNQIDKKFFETDDNLKKEFRIILNTSYKH